MELSSSAFAPGLPIPRRHCCEGEDFSPPLEWRAVPEDAVSLALIVDDPDAPVGTFTHWLAWGVNPEDRRPAEGGAAAVGGRGPPGGPGSPRYFSRLSALASEPAVPSGASRRELERAIAANVLAVAELVGTYER